VGEASVTGRITRVGNSLAVFIPAETARRAGLAAGDHVEATLESKPLAPFGVLSDIATEPYHRRKEEGRRDRI
jgi:antitoxin component of MazEF toxin-antitoxin module